MSVIEDILKDGLILFLPRKFKFNNLRFNNLMSIWSTNKMMCQFDYFIIELLHYLVIELLDY